jgi:hypothetical protein
MIKFYIYINYRNYVFFKSDWWRFLELGKVFNAYRILNLLFFLMFLKSANI